MYVGYVNLARHLASHLNYKVQDEKARVWRTILSYPQEGFGLHEPAPEAENMQAILDPAVVLGRMLCVAIDNEISVKNCGGMPFSWLLRLMEGEQKLSAVLDFIESTISTNQQNDLKIAIQEIREYFPGLFPSDSSTKKGDINDFKIRLRETLERLNGCNLFHISSPSFHRNWETSIERSEKSQHEYSDAKQQWSTIVGSEIESFCSAFCHKKTDNESPSWVLQAAGGHVLMATEIPDNQLSEFSEEALSFLQEKWTNKRNWAPNIQISWDGGAKASEVSNPDDPELILENLNQEFRDFELLRNGVRNNWAPFIASKTPARDDEDDEATLYLDVIGLSERCWPASQQTRENIPYRSREETISAFKKSRIYTTIIEATFGRIIAYRPPSKILSMGGDEMIAKISRRDYLDIIKVVEEICLQLYESIIEDSKIELLWWAMISEENHSLDGETIKSYKDTLKTYFHNSEHSRIKRRNMRFVCPMWTNIDK